MASRELGGRSLGGRSLYGRGLDGRGGIRTVLGSARPSWVPAGATTVFDYANGRTYFNGAIDTLSNNSLNYLVTSRSQTNILPYAGDLRAGVTWSSIGLGTSTTGISDPNGGTGAFKVVEDASLGRHLLYSLNATGLAIPAGSTLTAVFVLKAAERGFAIITVQDGGGNNFYASVNLSDGSIATTGSELSGKTGTGTYISGTSTSLGNGWWLFAITGTVDPAATAAIGALDLSNTLGANSYQGVAGSGINAWCCDVVLGSTGTIPMPAIGLEQTVQPTSRLLGTVTTLLPNTGTNALRLVGSAPNTVLTNAATSGQQAGYANFCENTGQNIQRLGATWKFTSIGAGLNGAATLITWKTQPITTAAAPNSGCHLAMGRTSWVYGKILNGNPVTTIASGSYSLSAGVPLSAQVVFDYANSRAIVTLPDGTVQTITDSDIAAQAGPWTTVEAFQNDAAADDRTGFFKSWWG